MTRTRYPILRLVAFHQMGVLQDFSVSRQAYDQFVQLADVLDAALALADVTAALSAAAGIPPSVSVIATLTDACAYP